MARNQLTPHAKDALRRLAIALFVTGAGSYILYRSLGEVRRRALLDRVRPHTGNIAGTPFGGACVLDALTGLVNTFGGKLVEAYADHGTFYGTVTANLTKAWDEREPLDDVDDADDAVEPIAMLVVSDLHCNVGMIRVIRRAAELAKVDMILNAGDTTMNGSAVEKICVTAFAKAAPEGVPFVSVTGNHDSAATAEAMAEAGMIVLSGDVQRIRGVRILGDADPNETRLGKGTRPVGDESAEQAGVRLGGTACAAPDGVDLLLVHTPKVGVAALEAGCVPVQISGHLHRRIDPHTVGRGTRYVNASTAGAVDGKPTVGRLRGTAEMTVLRFDPVQRVMLDYQVLTCQPDRSAQVGHLLPFPRGS